MSKRLSLASIKVFWLVISSMVVGTLVAGWDCYEGILSGRGEVHLQTVLGKVFLYSALLLMALLLCRLGRAQIKGLLRWWLGWLCHWIFSRHSAQWGLKALIVLFFLGTLFYVEENWRGKRVWDDYRHAQEAKGERLDFTHFIPPTVPAAQNFALIPLVASCYNQVLDANGQRVQSPNTNLVKRLEMNLYRTGVQGANLAMGEWQKHTFTDLAAWQYYYRKMFETNEESFGMFESPGAILRKQSATNHSAKMVVIKYETNEFPVAAQMQTPAKDVLFALDKFDPVIEELRLASQMPYSRFPLNYDAREPAQIILPHLKSLMSCAWVLRLRSIAELADGQPEKALADVRLTLYLASSISNEPFGVASSVRRSLIDFAVQPIGEGLARRQWQDDQLTALVSDLTAINAVQDYGATLRAERALRLNSIEYLRTERMANSIMDWNGDTLWPQTIMYRLSPAGWFYMNERAVARAYESALPTAAEVGQGIISPEISHRFGIVGGVLRSRHLIPDNIAISFFVPPLAHDAKAWAQVQAGVDMARITCALERHRRARGGYPSQLDVLAPQFIKELPHDVINGQPFHYRNTEGDSYLLYSIGWDGKDDGGVPEDASRAIFPNSPGDWVWSYPGKM